MTTRSRIVLLVGVLVCAGFAPGVTWAQSPTPVIAATPSADVAPIGFRNSGGRLNFVDGIAVGGTNAAPLTLVTRGTCTVNIASLAADATALVGCVVTGVLPGDLVFVQQTDVVATYSMLAVVATFATTNEVQFRVTNTHNTSAGDLPATAFNYLVVR